MKKLKTAGIWLLQILLAFILSTSGWDRMFGRSEMWAGRFEGWGYPDGFSYVIGGLEVLFGLALLVPKAAGIGAAGLIVIMVGAVGTHVLHGEPFLGSGCARVVARNCGLCPASSVSSESREFSRAPGREPAGAS